MQQAKVQIRYATAADNALLAELGAQTFRDTFAADNTPQNIAAYLAASFSLEKQAVELADPTSVFLLAEVEGAAVGYARLKRGQPAMGITCSRPIEIVRFYARKEWIGQGVGATLMKACLDEAKQRGCDTIWLDVWERNLRARAFYRKWGFVEVGTQVFELGDDLQNDLLMQRPVDIQMAANPISVNTDR
jgi:GNAT superfamily N-acetyltransferase